VGQTAATVGAKQIDLRLDLGGAPVLTQSFEQFRSERHFPVPCPPFPHGRGSRFAAVDVGKLKLGCLGATQTRRVQQQQNRSGPKVGRSFHQGGLFLPGSESRRGIFGRGDRFLHAGSNVTLFGRRACKGEAV
jgi:hypothetical protein